MIRNFFEAIGRYTLFLGMVFRKPEKWRIFWRQSVLEADKLILSSILIVSVISVFIGGVLVIQTASNMQNPLLDRMYVGYMVRESLVLEFCSTMVALILAGKMGSNIASEIGSMRISEQIDAMDMMGINSAGYLVLPITSDYMLKSAEDNTPTGGMGAICPVPMLERLKDRIRERIIDPTLYGMQVEQLSYKGVLTLSMMIKDNEEPYLVDYHVRLNDPATQAMVPLIKTDLISILHAMRDDKVNTIRLETSDMCAVAVVLASEGYPLYPKTGREIKGLDARFMEPIEGYPNVFIGAIQDEDGKAVTTGGRNITVVGKGRNLEEANRQAYDLIEKKAFKGLWYREDIGNAYFRS